MNNSKERQWDDSIRQRFLSVDAATVSDVLERLGKRDQALSPRFMAFSDPAEKMAGWAYTIRGQMTPYPGSGDPDKMHAVEGLQPGDVAVWSGDGDGVCYFGELIALGMKVRGCVGAVVNGGVRDTRRLKQHQFMVYARYKSPVQSIGRWKVTAYQVPVFLPGATSNSVLVDPGDFVLADLDGIVVVPHEHIEAALVEAERLTGIELSVRADIDSGASLKDMLKKHGRV